MSETCYARIMSRGQLTIPKAIRDVLGVKSEDCIAFVVENGTVRIVSSDDYAFQQFQAQMAGNDPVLDQMDEKTLEAWRARLVRTQETTRSSS